MNTNTMQAFTPARIVALVVIGVLVSGLVSLRFTQAEAISVPDGAKAGDLALEPCTYETEAGPMTADCGTLVVPENREDPAEGLIALPVTRIRARSDRPTEPIFLLWGGPGLTNMGWTHANRFADRHDVVMVGYRGVDGSVRLDCPEVESALSHSTDVLGGKSFGAYTAGFRDCAARLRTEGVDPTAYGLTQQVDDLEAARVALGYDRIDLLSESAGTRTAMIYAWRYPGSIHRSAMVAVNPPGNFLWYPETTDEQIGRYADLCSNDPACSARTDDLAASLRRTAADMPERWFFLPIDESIVRVATFWGLMEATPANAPLTGPTAIDSWLSAAEGDASGLWFASLFGDIFFPKAFVWGQYVSGARLDAQAARDYFASGGHRRDPNLGYDASAFAWGGGHMVDGWPAARDQDDLRRVQTSDVETLLIGGELDFAAPPQNATEQLLPHLPNGKQVLLSELGHTTDFWSYQPKASTRLITTFFDRGTADDSLYRPARVDFTPAPTMTMIAKIVAGALLSLAIVTIVSLLWVARRVHRRGRIGPRASVTLRSVFPILLGFGGWAFGILIVITTMQGVPLADELVVALSVGVPIGVGIYFAWVNRRWSASTKQIGFVAATAGALLGAWLGFNASEAMLGPLTAIVGSAVGANLLLILLDVAETRQDEVPAGSMEVVRVPERVDV
ncbi:MAG TPA: alpha/beta fold hydrolase [Actinomycetota bacterium]|nr:alpha/beta fold hydrolase [Actinomycetota bacterium]